MIQFPILVTERLTLRPLLLSDAHDIFALRSDPQINKYLGRQAAKTIEDAIGFIQMITENIQKNASFYWAITLTESKTFAGTICLFECSGEQCEIGYELLNAFQGKGIMKEAAGKVIEYAVQTMKMQRIEAFSHKDNHGSLRLLEKLGFKKATDADPDYCVFMYGR